MTTRDDKSPVFPKEWGWEKYETAVREQAAQCARLNRGRESITEAEARNITSLMHHWDENQVRAGFLPSGDEREKKGQLYFDIFAALEREAGDALNENREYKAGLAHWDLDKEKESRPHPERKASGRSRKDEDRER